MFVQRDERWAEFIGPADTESRLFEPKIKKTTTKNAARMPQINERNRLLWSALRYHRDRLSTAILAPFLAVAFHGNPHHDSAPATLHRRPSATQPLAQDHRGLRLPRPRAGTLLQPIPRATGRRPDPSLSPPSSPPQTGLMVVLQPGRGRPPLLLWGNLSQ